MSRAVAAARRAFDGGWAFTPPAERADWLRKLADGLEKRKERIASTISQEVGMPISMSLPIQAGSPVVVLRSFADLATSWPFERNIGHSLILREPVGVIGAITPWNYPLHQIIAKVAPALAAGCTVVLKPSELAPLNACILAEVCEEIALPPGLINIVHGYGPEVGEAIASHPDIDMVSFTGSVRAGTRVASVAAATVKKVTLELGGKSACVILEDAAFDKAVSTGVKNAMLNSGQTCSAWSRMIVPRAKMDDAVAIARQTLAKLPLGDPLDQATRLGPLISEAQRERVEGYIAAGRARRSAAGDRRRTAVTPAEGALRRADRLRGRDAGDADRARGDLRTGAVDPAVRLGRRGGDDRQRFDLRPGGRGLVRGRGAGAAAWPGASGPGRWISTVRAGTRSRRSAATSSLASAANSASSGWRSICR